MTYSYCLLQFSNRPPDDDHIIAEFNKFALKGEIGERYLIGNFVGSVFDSKGGYLTLPSQEVVLYVPPGAIEEGKRQPVYCHCNEYKYGAIHAGKVVLSPIVHCGPDGAEFERDVVLAFPHCAVNPNNWNFTALTRDKEGSWNKLPEDTTFVKDEFVFVFLDHFTGYTAEGDAKEGKNAQRRITIGATGCFHRDTWCQIKVGVWCDTGSRSESRQIPGISTSWKQRTAFCVSEKDKILITEIEDVDKGLQQLGSSKKKMIRLADVGTDKDTEVTNCQFTFRHADKPKDFFCTVSVTSDGQENIKLDLFFFPTDTQLSDADPKLAEMTNAELYRKVNADWDPRDSRVSEDLWRCLCQLLDVPRDGKKDWRGFAEKLGLEASQINTLELKESPTSRLLSFYFTMEKIRGNRLDTSLQRLMEIFVEMENHAAKTYVINYTEKASVHDSQSVSDDTVGNNRIDDETIPNTQGQNEPTDCA
ncbi:netrin receptor UNC5B-like [Ptychodera flava]|uniref:netrin receptor UNC5B-like n=1 Tax=Ptychodera flava TaxID=63121 RepID=UPI003969FF3A